MVSIRHQTRPDSRESEGDDGGLVESLWRKQQRDSIKKGSWRAVSQPLSRPTTSEVGNLFKTPYRQPIDVDAKRAELDAQDDAELAAKRTRIATNAQSAACWEDLISFLELHKLPGAYALAFSAHGIEDLSSLLLLDDSALVSLLERCNIDAMDEILLLEALRSSKAFQ